MPILVGPFLLRVNMSQILKAEIIRRFKTQGDFAQFLGASESTVSRILKDRRRLSGEEFKIWKKALQCDSSILEPVVDNR